MKLRKAGWTRIYDTCFPEDDLWSADRLVIDLVRRPDFSRRMTTPEFHHLLGVTSRASGGGGSSAPT